MCVCVCVCVCAALSTAIDRLSIIWKSDLTDKMKRSFFQAAFSLSSSGIMFHCLPSRELSKSDEPDIQDTSGETGTSI